MAMHHKYSVNECYFDSKPALITIEHPTTRKEISVCTDCLESEYLDKGLEVAQYGHIYPKEKLKDMQLALQEEELRWELEHGGNNS